MGSGWDLLTILEKSVNLNYGAKYVSVMEYISK